PGTLSVRLADGDPIAPIAASTGAGDLKALATEGGTTQTGRWSAGSVTLQTAVTGENDPPTAADATLAAVAEDSAAPPGASVAALFAPVFGDAADNQSAIPGGGNASTALGGIAIIGSAADPLSEGAWQYSTDGGGSWTAIAQGADDDTTAILLPGSALLRFVPVADYNGTPGALSVRLADAPQSFLAASDISGVVGNDPARDTDIWSVPVRLGTSVTPVNDAPSASPSQDFTLGEDDGPQTVAGFMQSIDPGGGPDEVGQAVSFAVTGITDGSVYTAAQLFAAQPVFTVATGAGNTLSFTPGDVLAQGETQTVTVTVSVTDDGGTADGGVDTGTPQTFTITLTGVNDAPTTTGIADQTSTDGQTIALDVSGSFSDPDGSDVLRFTATGLPPGLSIDPDTGLITGRIDFDASTGGPYTVTVTARDFDAGGNPTGTSVEATFTWGVANPPPVAVNDTDATDEATPISRAAGLGVIDANDSDGAPDGDALVVDQVNGSAGNVGTPVAGSAGGLFTLNADGSYDFDPNGDFASLGVGDSRATQITYRITDGEGGVSTATLTVTVTGVNDAPVARPDGGTTPEGTPVSGNVLTNDSDPEGDPLSVSAAVVDIDGDGIADPLPLGVPTLLRDAAGDPIGTLTLGANGAFTFAPAPNYAGPMPQVTYDVSDGAGGTATSTLNITVTPAIPAFPPTHGATGGADPVELSDRSRPGLVVDHIIDETANSQTSLFGTPALLSGLNTALGVEHPILTALDALQSLEGTAELSTRGADVFAGLAADGPITEAVRSIGFDPLDETLRVFNRDFPDEVHLDRAAPSGDPFAGQIAAARLEVPTRLGLMAGLAVETRGEAADIRLHLSDAAGETAPIATAQVRAGADADTGIARDGEGLHLTGLAAGVPVTLDVELVAGGNLSFVLILRAQGEGVTISEPASGTFSAATAQIAQADRTEAAQLMQAVKWGTR
ncbi:MAG: hypothetical protein EP307_05735, partial [Rhodobacteraceae bacterium]